MYGYQGGKEGVGGIGILGLTHIRIDTMYKIDN